MDAYVEIRCQSRSVTEVNLFFCAVGTLTRIEISLLPFDDIRSQSLEMHINTSEIGTTVRPNKTHSSDKKKQRLNNFATTVTFLALVVEQF